MNVVEGVSTKQIACCRWPVVKWLATVWQLPHVSLSKLLVIFARFLHKISSYLLELRNVESLSSHFVGPKPVGFQAFFGLS